MSQGSVVYVVDDDPSVSRALRRLFRVAGFRLSAFENAQDFLDQSRLESPSCLILDIHLPDLNGLDLQRELKKRNWGLPIIFITGNGDVPMAVEALRQGAIHFLSKPFDNQDLLAAVKEALQREGKKYAQQAATERLKQQLHSLTPRELEVFILAGSGVANKNIATRLGISLQTVKLHRGHVMAKLGLNSIADLARFAEKSIPLLPHRISMT